MASLTQSSWVWVNSGSWWWTGRPGVLQSMGSQRVRHYWVTELNSTFPQFFLAIMIFIQKLGFLGWTLPISCFIIYFYYPFLYLPVITMILAQLYFQVLIPYIHICVDNTHMQTHVNHIYTVYMFISFILYINIVSLVLMKLFFISFCLLFMALLFYPLMMLVTYFQVFVYLLFDSFSFFIDITVYIIIWIFKIYCYI